jgi:hypothetical protein
LLGRPGRSQRQDIRERFGNSCAIGAKVALGSREKFGQRVRRKDCAKGGLIALAENNAKLTARDGPGGSEEAKGTAALQRALEFGGCFK